MFFLRFTLFEINSGYRISQNVNSRLQFMRLCDYRRLFSNRPSATTSTTSSLSRNDKAMGGILKPNIQSKIDRLAEAADKKLAKYKFLEPFYELPTTEHLENWRPVYKNTATSRARLSRGIYYGYAFAAIFASSIAMNTSGLRDELISNPFICLAFVAVSLSFTFYLTYMARSFVVSMHAKDLPNMVKMKQAANKSAAPSQYLLCSMNPLTGRLKRTEFNLDDVAVFDSTKIQKWPLWRQLLHVLDPAKNNVRIRNRWFKIYPAYFIDGDFHGRLMQVMKQKPVKPEKHWLDP